MTPCIFKSPSAWAKSSNNILTICHFPPGNPENFQTIEISESAWKAHEKHGDSMDACPIPGDADGDGFAVDEGDCDDDHAAIHPGAIEVIDAIDQDCDGSATRIEANAGICFGGEMDFDFAGIAVNSAGDTNGDGIDDVLVTALGADLSGTAYLVYGGVAGMPDDLAFADAIIVGRSGDEARIVSGADLNGDRKSDVVLAAPAADGGAGLVAVFYGGSLTGSYAISDADVTLNGESGDNAGTSLATGDFNSDGFADLLVGTETGKVYLVYGGSLAGAYALSAGGAIFAGNASDRFGAAVASGDLNGDGFDDAIIAAPAADGNFGRTFVFLGGSADSLFGLLAGTVVMNDADAIITGTEASGSGFSLAASDANGDGFDEIFIGTYSGLADAAYLIRGRAGFSGEIDLSHDDALIASSSADNVAFTVANAKDVNDDGYADILVSEVFTATGSGEMTLFFGGVDFSPSAGLTISSGDYGFLGDAGDFPTELLPDLSRVTDGAGDIDGNGFADVLWGLPGADRTGPNSGKVCLFTVAFTDADAGAIAAFYRDGDGDGFGDVDASIDAYFAAEGYVVNASDCDDSDANVSPGDVESCNGVDDDCDGFVDEDGAFGATAYFQDADGDGFGDAGMIRQSCAQPDGFVDDNGDCDDASFATHPGATESCDDADNDCDGQADEDATDAGTWFLDGDQDGYGDPNRTQTACDQPSGYAIIDGDCSDGNPAIHPGVAEVCDGFDNDCDAAIDDGAVDASTWHPDVDHDGYGDSNASRNSCAQPEGYVTDGTDCADDAAVTHPGALEACDGLDNDCNGQPDDAAYDAPTWYFDADGDGYGDAAIVTLSCVPTAGYVGNATDCDDGNENINPGRPEICDDRDNDCDVQIDEDALDAPFWYHDGDGDLYGDPNGVVRQCLAPENYVTDGSDCDDAFATVHPQADEICDNVDNDCDAETDETGAIGAPTFYVDTDEDGFGSASYSIAACVRPDGFAGNGGDCADNASWISPLALETCDDGTDQDCDGFDLGCEEALLDEDFDGHTKAQGDCDDHYAFAFPGAAEMLNGRDNNCDGLIGEVDFGAGYSHVGEMTSDRSGTSIAHAGDVNGDGYGDFLIGSPFHDIVPPADPELDSGDNSGKVYLFLGGRGFTSVSLSAADAAFYGESPDDLLGTAVSGAGDVNNDGYADFLIGAPGALDGAGRAYLVYGSPDLKGEMELSDAGAVTFSGASPHDALGTSLSSAGDVNHDGYADVLISLPGAESGLGKVALFLGEANFLTEGFIEAEADAVFSGEVPGSMTGASVSSAGDVNGDDFSDILIGAPEFPNGSFASGKVYLVYGNASVTGEIPLSEAIAFADGAGEFQTGLAVDGIGDFNRDGYDDMAISSPGYADQSGRVAIVYGQSDAFSSSLLGAVTMAAFYGESGATLSLTGFSVSGDGDVNGDGCSDLLIGAPGFNASMGRAYVVYGGGAGCVHAAWSGDFNLANVADYIVSGHQAGAETGYAVALDGDINRDSLADALISSPTFDNHHDTGNTIYLPSGSPPCAPLYPEVEHADDCGNFVDENCDGLDLSCMDADNDGDGFSENGGDCNDTDAAIKPNAADACFDTPDTNCNCFDPDVLGSMAKVSSGWDHVLAIRSDGALFAWGHNQWGQLGSGNSGPFAVGTSLPIQIGNDTDWSSVSAGEFYSLAMKSDGSIWGWGLNDHGQVGNNASTTQYHPVRIGTDTDWVAIDTGRSHSTALKSNGTLWQWGSIAVVEDRGQGLEWYDSLVPVQIGTDSNWIQAEGGDRFTIALKNNGTLWSWGPENLQGELGLGDSGPRFYPTGVPWPPVGFDGNLWVAIAVGGNHTLSVDSDGQLWGWGLNEQNQVLGGLSQELLSPTRIGTDTDWSLKFAAGFSHSAAVKIDGTLWVWGGNLYGQVGNGTTTTVAPYIPRKIGTDSDWTEISLGGDFTAARKNNGITYSWGRNQLGQLGIGTQTNRLVPDYAGAQPNPDCDPNGDCSDATFDQDGDAYSPTQGDCDDLNAAIHPGVCDLSGNGDEDCDGNTDEDRGFIFGFTIFGRVFGPQCSP